MKRFKGHRRDVILARHAGSHGALFRKQFVELLLQRVCQLLASAGSHVAQPQRDADLLSVFGGKPADFTRPRQTVELSTDLAEATGQFGIVDGLVQIDDRIPRHVAIDFRVVVERRTEPRARRAAPRRIDVPRPATATATASRYQWGDWARKTISKGMKPPSRSSISACGGLADGYRRRFR